MSSVTVAIVTIATAVVTFLTFVTLIAFVTFGSSFTFVAFITFGAVVTFVTTVTFLTFFAILAVVAFFAFIALITFGAIVTFVTFFAILAVVAFFAFIALITFGAIVAFIAFIAFITFGAIVAFIAFGAIVTFVAFLTFFAILAVVTFVAFLTFFAILAVVAFFAFIALITFLAVFAFVAFLTFLAVFAFIAFLTFLAVIAFFALNAFSNTRHFKNAEQEKNYNNAWSVPEGQTPRVAGQQKKWFKEIWFSPMKKVEARKEAPKSEGNNPIHESLVLIKDPVIQLNQNAVIYSALGWLKSSTINGSMILDDAIKRVGAIAVMYALLETTKYMDKWFINKYYYIDTAMVPEVIYHEYAHIAMSDTMKTVHSVPVIEGMADYFATRVANRKKMYDELKDYANNRSKNPTNKDMYHPFLEGSWNATSDFTLSLLWLGKLEFDKANQKRIEKGQAPLVNYDDLVFTAHKDLNEFSDIMHGLNGALVNACKEKCDSLRTGVNTLNFVFEKKGFN